MNALSHEDASRLLPWLANGTLTGDERERVERHVHDCLACRSELREQHALRMLVQRHADVHVSAEQGFAELARRIESTDAPRPAPAAAGRARAGEAAARLLRGLGRGAAVLLAGHRLALANAVAAVVVAGLVVWLVGRGPADQPPYSTLTAQPSFAGADLDIVFAPGTTQDAMHEVLGDMGGTIVAGPSDVGRYTVRLEHPPNDAELDDLIQRLLADPRVRFAGRAYIAPRGP